MSPEKNFETYEDQHRHRGKLENTEKDTPDFRVDFYKGFWIMEKKRIELNGRARRRQLVSITG